MNLKHLFASLALAVAGPSALAGVSTSPTITGWGTRGAFTFGGEVSIAATGAVAGQFTIVIDQPDGTHVSCRYRQFWDGRIGETTATFYGSGYCHGPYGWFWSRNRFSITDGGSPGAGVDMIDVNFLGTTGVSIPGGPLDSGDLTVTP